MTLDFNDNHEITLSILHEDQPYLLWSSGVRFVFVMRGTVSALLHGQTHTLSPAGFCLIHPLELCQISCFADSKALMVYIPQDYIRLSGFTNSAWDCLAVDAQASPQTICDELRRLFAKIVSLYFNRAPKQVLNAAVMQFFQFLEQNFHAEKSDAGEHLPSTSMDRITQVLKLIHSRWNEDISVPELAEQVHVSPNYLSRFFSRHIHMTITDYIGSIRIHHALTMLREDHCSVTDVALQAGFPNSSAFIRKFKQQFGVTPKQYAKDLEEQRKNQQPDVLLPNMQTEVGDFAALFKYLPLDDDRIFATEKTLYPLQINASAEGRPIRPIWQKLLNFGYAREGLLASVQQQIMRAQQEIGFEYIRFHGIFDDNIQIYQENSEGQPVLNFLYADLLTDFLISQGFKLYIELGLMPSALKKYDIFVLSRSSNYSVAAQQEKWQQLVSGSIQHWITRYGLDTVRTWKFTTMGIHVPVFTEVTFDEFYTHYQSTWQAVKSVDPLLQFGGPGGFASIVWAADILPDFFRFAEDHGCFPDFITTQDYPHQNVEDDMEFMNTFISQDFLPTTLSGDRHFTRNLCTRLCQLMRAVDREHTPIWLEECNSTIWQRDLSGDTCYKAAWLCHSIAENYDSVEAFGYWLLTDFIEERGPFNRLFHGGYGLFTFNGIPKAGWQALNLLHSTGDQVLYSGDWYLVTRSARQLQILLFHYCDYDSLYRHRYRKLEYPEEAYRVFRTSHVMDVRIQLNSLVPQPHRMQQFIIDREHGSSFDQWLRWGAPNDLSVADVEQLHRASEPGYRSTLLCPDEKGEFVLQSRLQPHEVQLFIIELNNG